MTKAAQKLALTPPKTITLDKLVLHEGNVRHIKAGISIETLAAAFAGCFMFATTAVMRAAR